jgi:hypothetical protein
MKSNPAVWSILVLLVPAPLLAQKSTSDLMPPTRRQETVDAALWLTRTVAPRAVPDDLPNPFNPSGFDQPEGAPSSAEGRPRPNTQGSGSGAPSAAPMGDREILETLASDCEFRQFSRQIDPHHRHQPARGRRDAHCDL